MTPSQGTADTAEARSSNAAKGSSMEDEDSIGASSVALRARLKGRRLMKNEALRLPSRDRSRRAARPLSNRVRDNCTRFDERSACWRDPTDEKNRALRPSAASVAHDDEAHLTIYR